MYFDISKNLSPDLSVRLEQHGIISSILEGFPELVRDLGGDPRRLLKMSGLNPEVADGHPSQIAFWDFERLMHRSAAVLDCPDFGARLADRSTDLEKVPELRGLLRNSPSLNDLFECCATRMEMLSSAVHLTLIDHPTSSFKGWRYEFAGMHGPAAPQISELFLRLAQRGIDILTAGKVQPREIWLTHPPLSSHEHYLSRFGTTIRFAQVSDVIFYEVGDMEQPVAGSDRELFERELRIVGGCAPPAQEQVMARIRRSIHVRLPNGDCERAAVAADLGVSIRTLTRRLDGAGYDFCSLKNEIRQQLAIRYLTTCHLSLRDVTTRLGLAEVATLCRLVRRWFGTTPLSLRHRLLTSLQTR